MDLLALTIFPTLRHICLNILHCLYVIVPAAVLVEIVGSLMLHPTVVCLLRDCLDYFVLE